MSKQLWAPLKVNDGNDPYTFCRICGNSDCLYWEKFEDGFYGENYFICPCCGGESGVDDVMGGGMAPEDISSEFKDIKDIDLQAIKEYRKRWMQGDFDWQNGEKAFWFTPKTKPQNWDLEKQMKNIPEEFR